MRQEKEIRTLRTGPRIHRDAANAKMARRVEPHTALGIGVETLQVICAIGVA